MAYGNQTLGRGEVHFSEFKTGTYVPAGFRYFGNTPSLDLTTENEELKHYDSDHGIKTQDKSIILETTAGAETVLDDIQPENIALALFGSTSTVSQTSASNQTETFDSVIEGRSYQIGITNSTPTGIHSITIDSVAVGASTMTAPADYTVDLDLGILSITEGGGIATGDDVIVTYDRVAKSRVEIISGDEQVPGAMRFISYNPEGEKFDYYFPYVKIAPNGSIGLKKEEWQEIPLSIEILKAPNRERIYVNGRPFTAS